MTSLRRTIEDKRKLSGFLGILVLLLAFLAWYRTGSVVTVVVILGIFVGGPFLVSFVLSFAAVTAYWIVQSKKRGAPQGGYVFAGSIPKNDISCVEQGQSLNRPILKIYFNQDNNETIMVMIFSDENNRFHQAKDAFEMAGIPTEM